jgi:hypothetical protein
METGGLATSNLKRTIYPVSRMRIYPADYMKNMWSAG